MGICDVSFGILVSVLVVTVWIVWGILLRFFFFSRIMKSFSFFFIYVFFASIITLV